MQQIQHAGLQQDKMPGKTRAQSVHNISTIFSQINVNAEICAGDQQASQLQVSTNSNDGMNGSIASLSPNAARMGTFTPPHIKNHRVVVGLAGNQSFQHPMQRPVSVQIPRQAQIQQRMMQSPFSPQSQTPQSPHDQFPLSPATPSHDQFSRPASECSQPDPYLNVSDDDFPVKTESIVQSNENLSVSNQSPQTPRSYGHHSPTTSASQSPAYTGSANQVIPQSPSTVSSIRLNIGGGGGYAQAPGTPRPNFATDTTRPTVYVNSQVSPYSSPVNEQFPAPLAENNRQLRDLLQRQQMVAPNQQTPLPVAQQANMQRNDRWNVDAINTDEMMNVNANPNQHSGDVSNTFRQPLPPAMISRPQRIVGPQHQIRPHGMIENINRVSLGSFTTVFIILHRIKSYKKVIWKSRKV